MWAVVCVCLPLQLKIHVLSSKLSIVTFTYSLPPIPPSTSSAHWKNPAVSSSLRCAVFSFFLIHPTLFSQTIYLHMLVCPFTYFYKWIHMFLSSAFPPQVGFHINHNLILHRQLGCLPNSSEDGGADRVGGRPGRSDGDRVWYHARRIHNDFLSGQRLLMSLHEKHCLCS